jgi:hypothetical protein
VRAIVDEALADERMMLEQRRRAIAHQKIHCGVREGAPQIRE